MLLTVKEFDTIISKDTFDGLEEGVHCIPPKYFQELDNFIRNQQDLDIDGNPLDYFRLYSKKGNGYAIKVRNHVGIIQLESGYQIQILPKIDFVSEEDGEYKNKRVFIDMLRTLKDFPGRLFASANLRTESINLYEIFINMFVFQVSLLTRKGLKSSYISKEDNLNILKGKLLINKHIKENIGHAERFYVSYDEYQLNRAENRLIKATLMKLQKISTSSSNLRLIRQQLLYFELVEASRNYEKDFADVKIDRTTKDYEDLITWAKVFLMNKSFSTFSGNSKSRALLFPMEKVFESFVTLHVRRVFEAEGYVVSTQDVGQYLLKEDGRRIFSLRPDIVLTDKNNRTIIMDMKWKRLFNNSEKNYGISQADMYQMYAYSKKYNANSVWVLYPLVHDFENKIIKFKDDDTTINIYFIDVSNIEHFISNLLEMVRCY